MYIWYNTDIDKGWLLWLLPLKTKGKEVRKLAAKAVVQKVILDGKHGPFFVATSDQIKDGSVTCSLEPTVWLENKHPEEGEFVFLDELRQKRAGWRAKVGRFWKPSDEQTERSSAMEFLYPTSRKFPFDEVCEQIIRELEQRNWEVPGIAVEFDMYGSGEAKYALVRNIRGEEFRLHFGRPQGRLGDGRWNNTAAVTDIVIPKKELSVYDDESGPRFHLYVGNDWGRDREQFMNSSKFNSKLSGKPRTYLLYKGECHCDSTAASWGRNLPHTHGGQRPPLLVHNNDLGREYEPKGDEPKLFKTAEVFEEFRQYLADVVLGSILSHPIPGEKVDPFPESALVPFPESIGPIFTFGEQRDDERIQDGKRDASQLDPSDRYGLSSGGYRLMSLGTPNDGTVPEVAYKGFLWCGMGEVVEDTEIDSLEVPGHYRWTDRERFVIRIKPNRANDIFVADHAQYEKRQKEIWESITDGRTRLTDAEVVDFTRARARTIVPISEYQGDYEQPVVLISRELDFDEVEVVSGPHEYQY